jgi:uncharacterized protein
MSWFWGWLLAGKIVLASIFPQPLGYVNDFAGLISAPVEDRLEAELAAFTASSGSEVALVTLESLKEDTIENTAVALFEQWGIGKKNQDNGVLLLIAAAERELRIEVGYGLEPILTDSRAGAIIREDITPKFKAGDYDGGVSAGVEAIMAVINGVQPQTPNTSQDGGWATLVIILFILIMIVWLSKKNKQSNGQFIRQSVWGSLKTGRSGGSSRFGGFSGGRSGGGGTSGKW